MKGGIFMANKTVCIGMVICILLSLCACKESPNNTVNENTPDEVSFVSVMLGDKYIEEWNENNVICNVTWNKLKLSGEDEKKFPKLKKTFDKVNNEASKDAKALMYELSGAAKDLEGDKYNPLCLEGQSKVYLQRADTKIVSLLEDVFVHSGGVHPDYHYITSNFDPETGEKLVLTDVMKSLKGLPDILEGELNIKYDYLNFDENQLWTIFKGYSPEDYNWTLDYQGITFWFSPYDIASYAAGPLSVKIYFDEEPYIFNEEYTKAPSENYAMMLPMRQKIDFDLNLNDDKKDCIEVDTMLDQYGSYNMLSVTINGKNYTDEINYAYAFDVYLAHIGDKNYIYSDSVSDNDYHMFSTWDINGDTPKITQELYGTEVDYEYIEGGYEDGTVYRQAFNNSDFLRLETRFEILGTRGATATYKLSETDGKPEMTDKAYTFNYGHDVKTTKPLEAELLPEMEEIELPVGTSLTPYQTDGKSYVDLKTEDGVIVRFSIDISEWPRKVNGMPEDECFENLMYAG